MELTKLQKMFLQEAKIGYKVKIKGLSEGLLVIKALSEDYVELLDDGDGWESDGWKLDPREINAYRIMQRETRPQPFTEEIVRICAAVEGAKQPAAVALEDVLALVTETEKESGLESHIKNVWSSCQKAKDAYSFDENMRKCSRLLMDEYPDSRALLVLRAYAAMRCGEMNSSKREYEPAACYAKAEKDFAAADCPRGLYLLAAAQEKCDPALMQKALAARTGADLLYFCLQKTPLATAAAAVHALLTEDISDRDAIEAAVYLAEKSAPGELYLPEGSDLCAAANARTLLERLAALKKDAPLPEKPAIRPEPALPAEVQTAPVVQTVPKSEPEPAPEAPAAAEIYQSMRRYTGTIHNFSAPKFCGHIEMDPECNFLEPTHYTFFHMKFIEDDALYEQLLTAPFPRKDYTYRVSFIPCKNRGKNDDYCAGRILWLNPDELPEKAAPAAESVSADCRGYLYEFKTSYRPGGPLEKGRVQMGDASCNFLLGDVEDPYLQAYLRRFWFSGSKELPVRFALAEDSRGMKCARALRLDENAELDVSAAEIEQCIPKAALERWQAKISGSAEASEAQEPERPPFVRSFAYDELEVWEGALPTRTRKDAPSVLRPAPAVRPAAAPSSPWTPPAASSPWTPPAASSPQYDTLSVVAPASVSNKSLTQQYLEMLASREENSCADQLKKASIFSAPGEKNPDLLRQAVDLYREVLRKGTVADVTKALPALIDTLSRMEKFEEALAVLDAVRGSANPYMMGEEGYINRRISVLQNLREEKYRDDLVESLTRKAELSSSYTAQLHVLSQAANIRFRQGRYSDALELMDRWSATLDAYRRNSNADIPQSSYVWNLCLRARCLYRLQPDKAKELAARILETDPNNTAAQMIVDGRPAEEIDRTVEELMAETRRGPVPFTLDLDESMPQFVADLLSDFRLSDYARTIMPGLVNADEEFTGTLQQAKRAIDALSLQKRSAQKPDERCNIELCCAKILLTFIQRSDSPVNANAEANRTFSGGVRVYLGRALACMADARILDYQPDSARYMYTLALKLLEPSNMTFRWSLYRGIASLLTDGEQLIEAINRAGSQWGETQQQRSLNTMAYLARSYPSEKAVRRFVSESLLLQMDNPGLYAQNQIFDRLYAPEALRGRIWNVLCEINGAKVEDALVMPDEFRQGWNSAISAVSQRYRDFAAQIHTLPLDGTVAELEKALQTIRSGTYCSWLHDLGSSDDQRLHQFLEAAASWMRYLREKQSMDAFASKRHELNSILRICRDQTPGWLRNPTRISSELLPKMQILRSLAQSEQNTLLKSNPPRLSIELSEESAVLDGDIARVQVCVRNAENNLDARDVALEIPDGADYRFDGFAGPSHAGYLSSGDSVHFVVRLKLSEDIVHQPNFAFDVICRYGCSDSAEEQEPVVPVRARLTAAMYDRNSVEKIPNPYSADGHSCAPELFYGRDKDIDRILEEMQTPGDPQQMAQGKGVVIYGQKRAGKTSIKDFLRERILAQFGEKQRILMVDIGSIGDCQTESGISFLSLYSRILDEISASLTEQYPELGEELYDMLLDASDAVLASSGDAAQTAFLHCIHGMLRAANRPGLPNMRIVLLVDEFTYLYEQILQGKNDPACMTFFKALIENYKFFIIAVAQDSYPSFSGHTGCANALAVFRPIRISYLEPEPARRLITEPTMYVDAEGCKRSRFNEKSVSRLLDLTACSAYLIQLLCGQLVNYMNDEGLISANEGIVETFLNERIFGGRLPREKFDAQINDLQDMVGDRERPEDNFKLLREIAIQSEIAEYAPVQSLRLDRLGFGEARLMQLIAILRDREVLVRREREDRYGVRIDEVKIKVTLLKEWFLKVES